MLLIGCIFIRRSEKKKRWQNISAAMLADRGMSNSRGTKKKVDIPYYWYFLQKTFKTEKLQIYCVLF